MADSPWRDRLRPASFRGVQFHIDLGARASGRRVALHEFPHRDDPFAEDMGRRARRFSVTGYVVSPYFLDERDDLVEALEAEGAGLYVHPTQGEFDVMVEQYQTAERREKGGYAEFEITFCEAGNTSPFTIVQSTDGAVDAAANTVANEAVTSLDKSTADPNAPVSA